MSSDKTHLSNFSGDKAAWPVYISIGNLSKDIRHQSSQHAMVLIAYISISKLKGYDKSNRSLEIYRLFHRSMRSILEPLYTAGKEGVWMTCADGGVRHVYPIVAAYIADHPEQCLVSGCQENFCPKCQVPPEERGEGKHTLLRDPQIITDLLFQASMHLNTRRASRGAIPPLFVALGLRELMPFWLNLPYCNIFYAITPDLLHQLHKGVFKDHGSVWTGKALTGNQDQDELDARFKSMPSHPEIRHFNHGISLVSQWTGTEYKNMEKVYLGVLAGAAPTNVVRPMRALLDFIYYAHWAVHTNTSLNLMHSSWQSFHSTKSIFVTLGIRKHFNIPKIHAMVHYVESIRALGTADGYNTESSERLHIDFAKHAYNASNKRDHLPQMAIWLSRQEKIDRFCKYLAWTGPPRSETQALQDGSSVIDDRNDMDNDDADHIAIPGKHYRVVQNPTSIPVSKMVQSHRLTDFNWYLEQFIQHTSQTYPGSVPVNAAALINDSLMVSLYKRMYIGLPSMKQVSKQVLKDTIRATPGREAEGLQKATPDRFDTLIAREYAPIASGRGRNTRSTGETK